MKPMIFVSLAVAVTAVSPVPAGATIATFANYSGVGGANLYWQRTGTTYTVATPAAVAPLRLATVRGTPSQQAAIIAANAAATTAHTDAVAAAQADADTATAASKASALATAGGNLFTIATPDSTTPGTVATKFSFLNPVLFALGALDASFQLNAVATPGSVAQRTSGYDFQPIFSGSFSFTYTGATTLHVLGHAYRTGANLLTANFVGGSIAGQDGGTSGSATASTSVPGETITYTSDLIRFTHTISQDFAISASSITSALGFSQYQALNSFSATTTGLFATQPLPELTASVPEPATWAMLVAGFGLVGVGVRRRTGALAA
jgi:hypothetical protein